MQVKFRAGKVAIVRVAIQYACNVCTGRPVDGEGRYQLWALHKCPEDVIDYGDIARPWAERRRYNVRESMVSSLLDEYFYGWVGFLGNYPFKLVILK